MTCREFADFLDGYAAGELPSGVRSAFEHHLELCVNCVRYLEQYRQSIAMGRRAFELSNAALPSDVPEDLVRGILDALKRTSVASGFSRKDA
jgi:anti-sigma factor RsiW